MNYFNDRERLIENIKKLRCNKLSEAEEMKLRMKSYPQLLKEYKNLHKKEEITIVEYNLISDRRNKSETIMDVFDKLYENDIVKSYSCKYSSTMSLSIPIEPYKVLSNKKEIPINVKITEYINNEINQEFVPNELNQIDYNLYKFKNEVNKIKFSVEDIDSKEIFWTKEHVVNPCSGFIDPIKKIKFNSISETKEIDLHYRIFEKPIFQFQNVPDWIKDIHFDYNKNKLIVTSKENKNTNENLGIIQVILKTEKRNILDDLDLKVSQAPIEIPDLQVSYSHRNSLVIDRVNDIITYNFEFNIHNMNTGEIEQNATIDIIPINEFASKIIRKNKKGSIIQFISQLNDNYSEGDIQINMYYKDVFANSITMMLIDFIDYVKDSNTFVEIKKTKIQ